MSKEFLFSLLSNVGWMVTGDSDDFLKLQSTTLQIKDIQVAHEIHAIYRPAL